MLPRRDGFIRDGFGCSPGAYSFKLEFVELEKGPLRLTLCLPPRGFIARNTFFMDNFIFKGQRDLENESLMDATRAVKLLFEDGAGR